MTLASQRAIATARPALVGASICAAQVDGCSIVIPQYAVDVLDWSVSD